MYMSTGTAHSEMQFTADKYETLSSSPGSDSLISLLEGEWIQ